MLMDVVPHVGLPSPMFLQPSPVRLTDVWNISWEDVPNVPQTTPCSTTPANYPTASYLKTVNVLNAIPTTFSDRMVNVFPRMSFVKKWTSTGLASNAWIHTYTPLNNKNVLKKRQDVNTTAKTTASLASNHSLTNLEDV